MIVLHTIWDSSSGKLHIWAESSSLAMTTRKRTARQTEGSKPRIHPFALAHDALLEELGKLSGSLLVENARIGTLTLRLPSTAKGPHSSPELTVEKESEDAL